MSASCFRRSERIASVGIFVVRMCLRKSKITSAQAMETGLALPEGGSFESNRKVAESAE